MSFVFVCVQKERKKERKKDSKKERRERKALDECGLSCKGMSTRFTSRGDCPWQLVSLVSDLGLL